MFDLSRLDRAIQSWTELQGWPVQEFLRLLLATVCGGLLGFEREVRGRQAGFRTHMLVCMGSAIVMLVSTEVARLTWKGNPSQGLQISVDPARIAYGVMGGIGFLGAGAIIKSGTSVRGLTTAASLWCVAALGLAAGLGMYLFCLIVTLLMLAVLWLLGYCERFIPKRRFRLLTVRRSWEPGCIEATVTAIEAFDVIVQDAGFARSTDLKSVDITLRLLYAKKHHYYQLESELQQPQMGYEIISASAVEN